MWIESSPDRKDIEWPRKGSDWCRTRWGFILSKGVVGQKHTHTHTHTQWDSCEAWWWLSCVVCEGVYIHAKCPWVVSCHGSWRHPSKFLICKSLKPAPVNTPRHTQTHTHTHAHTDAESSSVWGENHRHDFNVHVLCVFMEYAAVWDWSGDVFVQQWLDLSLSLSHYTHTHTRALIDTPLEHRHR